MRDSNKLRVPICTHQAPHLSRELQRHGNFRLSQLLSKIRRRKLQGNAWCRVAAAAAAAGAAAAQPWPALLLPALLLLRPRWRQRHQHAHLGSCEHIGILPAAHRKVVRVTKGAAVGSHRAGYPRAAVGSDREQGATPGIRVPRQDGRALAAHWAAVVYRQHAMRLCQGSCHGRP